MKVHSIVSFFQNKVFLLTGIVLGALTCSCEEEFPEPMFTTSVIRGDIDYYYNTDSDPYPEGISVIARGPYPDKSALTNSSGNFEINGLGNGTYKLEISKEGFGTKYQYGIQLFGNDTVGVRDMLYEKVTGTIPKLLTIESQNTSYYWLDEHSIDITTNKTGSGEIPCRIFMAVHKDVSYKNYQWSGRVHSGFSNRVDKFLLGVHGIPFESGQKVYLKVYICNPEEEGYLNHYTGLWTFSTLEADEHSEVMSFTMP